MLNTFCKKYLKAEELGFDIFIFHIFHLIS